MKLRLKLTSKITLIFILFAVFLLVGLGLLAYNRGYEALYQATVAGLLSAANEKQAALNKEVEDLRLNIATHAASPRVRDAVTALLSTSPNSPSAREAYDRLVAELLPWTGPRRQYLVLFVVEAESGKVIAATDAQEEGTFKEDRPYFLNGLHGPYLQTPFYSLRLQGPEMIVSTPLRSADGKLLGVFVGRVNMNEMNAIINMRTGVHRTDEAFLVNTSNLFITQPHLAPDTTVLRRGVYSEAVKRCLAGESGILSGDDYRGVPVISAYRWLPKRQLGLIVKIDQEEAFEPMHKFRNILIIIGSLIFLVAVAVGISLARTITSPILALQAGVTRFGHGEWDVRLPETRNDELGVLAREFNEMATALSEKEAQLRQHGTQLENANKNLAEEIDARKLVMEELRNA
ncbi:MAG: HAMP domain-containing protein, partial [Chloroflexota bacterium]